MKTAIFAALSLLFFKPAFAGKSANICDKNPSAPQCVQARAKIPPSLPQRYALDFLVEDAKANIRIATQETAGETRCMYVNSKHTAFDCHLTTLSGRLCRIELLQIWENADYQITCEGGIAQRVMVNPGPVPETMD